MISPFGSSYVPVEFLLYTNSVVDGAGRYVGRVRVVGGAVGDVVVVVGGTVAVVVGATVVVVEAIVELKVGRGRIVPNVCLVGRWVICPLVVVSGLNLSFGPHG